MECRYVLQLFISALLACALCGPAQAITLDNLYSVVIQVPDNTNATRGKYLPQAFAELIKRVASSHNILNHPQYLAATEHLDRFVSHYFYTENDAHFTLTLRFNEQAVNNLLNKIGRHTLGKNRPQILLWLVMGQEGSTQFVTQGAQTAIVDKIDALAVNYGLPVIFPLLDLTERLFVTEKDVANFNLQPLIQAAQRYNTGTVLLGNMHNIGGVWHCEWRLSDGEQNIAWHTNGNNLDEELELMFNQVADQLIANSTQVKFSKVAKQGVTLRVKGVKSVGDYAKILEHLKRIPVIHKVEIGSVESNQAIFLVTADGGMDEVVKALRLSNLLIPEESDQTAELIYRTSL